MSTSLFNEFEPLSASAWKQKIQVDLKGADYNDTLLWKTDEGITVKPFYTKEDRTDLEISLPKDPFKICQSIYVHDESIANKLAIDVLKRGATAIHFRADRQFDHKKLLKEINTKETTLYFHLDFLEIDFTKELHDFCQSENTYFQIDPIGKLASTGNWYKDLNGDFDTLKTIINQTSQAISIDVSLYQNAGANMVQQLAYGLAHANEYINTFGSNIIKHIHFKFSVGSNYFFEISKLRAFRAVYQSLTEAYGLVHQPHIFCSPSKRNKTIYDYNVNMLRTTSECMSAILGGSNTVCNLSYDALFHKSNEFGERIARNQLLILQQESYLNEAQAVANGSYYIDAITEQLAGKALALFKQLEKSGGFLKQLKSEQIQKKIKEQATKEQEAFNSKKLVLLGTNKLINEKDKVKGSLEIHPFLKQNKIKTLIPPILEKRLSEETERHRLNTE